MPDELHAPLSAGARRIAETAQARQRDANHAALGVHHWLLALVERHGPMAASMAQNLDATTLAGWLRDKLKAGETGDPLDAAVVVERAVEIARARGKTEAAERDVARVVLAVAGYKLAPEAAPASKPAAPGAPPQKTAEAPARTNIPTPTLEKFGRDLTAEARDGRLRPVIGRADEVALMIETLCRRTKRNPVLVGPAGVGKTAIVEGLAQLIVRGEVPELLRGTRLFAIQPSMLVAGSGIVGELDKRMQGVLAEASQPGVLLFIDEIHSIIGAGGREGSGDIASLLKPALARGDLACIAATTDDEYRRFIEQDGALERRFQPVRVQEPSEAQTLEILGTLAADLGKLRGVSVGPKILAQLVDFAGRYLRNRNFPDKAVDLLEQCVAHAIMHGRKEVLHEDAENVASRMIGMPVALPERLQKLREELAGRGLMGETHVAALASRLSVTLRGLDIRHARPNAVLLLAGAAMAAHDEALAAALATALYGAAERVVTVDFSRLIHEHDVTQLIGAPPGYVGYQDRLAIHGIAQMPWCVVRARNIDLCHPAVREIFTVALADGFITDARGRRVFLSDAVVLMTAGIEMAATKSMGFGAQDAAPDPRAAATQALGGQLVAQCDLILTGPATNAGASRRLIEESLLPDLATRYLRQGVRLAWTGDVIEWLIERYDSHAHDWTRLADEELSALLIPWLDEARTREISIRLERGGDGKISVAIETAGNV